MIPGSVCLHLLVHAIPFFAKELIKWVGGFTIGYRQRQETAPRVLQFHLASSSIVIEALLQRSYSLQQGGL